MVYIYHKMSLVTLNAFRHMLRVDFQRSPPSSAAAKSPVPSLVVDLRTKSSIPESGASRASSVAPGALGLFAIHPERGRRPPVPPGIDSSLSARGRAAAANLLLCP